MYALIFVITTAMGDISAPVVPIFDNLKKCESAGEQVLEKLKKDPDIEKVLWKCVPAALAKGNDQNASGLR